MASIEMFWCSTSKPFYHIAMAGVVCTMARDGRHQCQLRYIYHFHFAQRCQFTTSFTLMYFGVFVQSRCDRIRAATEQRFRFQFSISSCGALVSKSVLNALRFALSFARRRCHFRTGEQNHNYIMVQ